MIGRAAAEPLPDPIVLILRDPLEQISQAAQDFLRACADALRERKNPAALDTVEQALAKIRPLSQRRNSPASASTAPRASNQKNPKTLSRPQLPIGWDLFRGLSSDC
jgi:hypothetical protein